MRWGKIPERAARAHDDVGARALRVLIAIAAHATGEITLAQIAELTGIDRRGVPVEIAALVKAGLLHRESGTAGANRYTVLLDAEVTCQDVSPEVGDDMPRHVKGDMPGRVTHLIERDSDSGASHQTRAREEKKGFEEVWSVYPHKVDRFAAERAYRAALDGGAHPGEILEGLRRYMAMKPPDRQWLNLTTFFSRQRWRDRPAQLEILMSIDGGRKASGLPREADKWAARLDIFFGDRRGWVRDLYGPSPDESGCEAPAELIAAARQRARSAA